MIWSSADSPGADGRRNEAAAESCRRTFDLIAGDSRLGVAERRFERPIGDMNTRVARGILFGGEVLVDGHAGAAGRAHEQPGRALDFQILGVDARGDLDRRVPGNLALVLLDLKPFPDGARFDARCWVRAAQRKGASRR